MSGILRLFRTIATKHPWTVQASQAGGLMAAGDVIAQTVVEKKSLKEINIIRTAQFGFIGFTFCGPVLRAWYHVLDKKFGSSGGKTVLKKVSLDQLAFAPSFIVLLLGTIGLVQGKSVPDVVNRVKHDYTDVLINNYKLWPAVQLCNFYFVPLQYQVLVVQIVAIFWNTYLSWKANQSLDGISVPAAKEVSFNQELGG